MPYHWLEFIRIEQAVRHGQEPNNPTLLGAYLETLNQYASEKPTDCDQHSMYLRGARVLLETICDTYLPQHWRRLCLDNIYQPMFAAQRCASSESEKTQVRMLRQELNTMGNYFL